MIRIALVIIIAPAGNVFLTGNRKQMAIPAPIRFLKRSLMSGDLLNVDWISSTRIPKRIVAMMTIAI